METVFLRAFLEYVGKAVHNSSISFILEQLFFVFAITTLRNASADFIRVNICHFKIDLYAFVLYILVEIVHGRSNL